MRVGIVMGFLLLLTLGHVETRLATPLDGGVEEGVQGAARRLEAKSNGKTDGSSPPDNVTPSNTPFPFSSNMTAVETANMCAAYLGDWGSTSSESSPETPNEGGYADVAGGDAEAVGGQSSKPAVYWGAACDDQDLAFGIVTGHVSMPATLSFTSCNAFNLVEKFSRPTAKDRRGFSVVIEHTNLPEVSSELASPQGLAIRPGAGESTSLVEQELRYVGARYIIELTARRAGTFAVYVMLGNTQVLQGTLTVSCGEDYIMDTVTRSCVCPVGSGTTSERARDACALCGVGKFKSKVGNSPCEECPPGSYAPDNGLGTCVRCPVGKYQFHSGQNTCNDCEPGSYAGAEGQVNCTACAPGTYTSAMHSRSCTPCSAGLYTSFPGSRVCDRCPVGSTSLEGGVQCTICEAKYYQIARYAGSGPHVFFEGSNHSMCMLCSDTWLNRVTCPFNTTLETIKLAPGYWRPSKDTVEVQACEAESVGSTYHSSEQWLNSTACQGGVNFGERYGDGYCNEGHTGPWCKVCTREGEYYSPKQGHCIKCPSNLFAILHKVYGPIFYLLVVLGVCKAVTLSPYEWMRPAGLWLSNTAVVVGALGATGILKQLINLYQVSIPGRGDP